MDDLLEVILEIVPDGTIEAASSRKVPLPLRILLGAFVWVFLLIICGVMVKIGIEQHSVILVGLSVLIFVVYVYIIISKIIKCRR